MGLSSIAIQQREKEEASLKPLLAVSLVGSLTFHAVALSLGDRWAQTTDLAEEPMEVLGLDLPTPEPEAPEPEFKLEPTPEPVQKTLKTTPSSSVMGQTSLASSAITALPNPIRRLAESLSRYRWRRPNQLLLIVRLSKLKLIIRRFRFLLQLGNFLCRVEPR